MKIIFSVGQTAALLGKSPGTLRSWEAKEYFRYPRVGQDRKLDPQALRDLTDMAEGRGYIGPDRANHVRALSYSIEALT